MLNSSIWPIDRTLSGITTPGQSGPRSDGNEGVFCSPISKASPSDYLASYPGYPLGGFYLSSDMQSVYSAAPADWASKQYDFWFILK